MQATFKTVFEKATLHSSAPMVRAKVKSEHLQGHEMPFSKVKPQQGLLVSFPESRWRESLNAKVDANRVKHRVKIA